MNTFDKESIAKAQQIWWTTLDTEIGVFNGLATLLSMFHQPSHSMELLQAFHDHGVYIAVAEYVWRPVAFEKWPRCAYAVLSLLFT